MTNILLVEDDRTIAKIIRYYLDEGYEITWVSDAGEALSEARKPYDIVLLDIMLPDADGLELCRSLRKHMSCPIIFISCVDDEDTIVSALEMGGDDYLTKPFNCKVLRARIEANLRRVNLDKKQNRPGQMKFGGFEILVREQSVLRDGEKYKLSPIEFDMLMYLIDRQGTEVTLDELYQNVWGRPSYGDVRTVIVHMCNLRKKIEREPNAPVYIQSRRRKGYCFTVGENENT